MSYAPKGASLPARFKKPTNRSDFKQRPRDRLVTVLDYNLADKSLTAIEDGTNRKIEARINPDKVGAGNRSASDKWNGNIIDERMEKANAINSRIVLEACETERKLQKNGEEVSFMRCNWIASPPDPNPNKSFTGVITVSQNGDRIFGVQVWDRIAIDPAKNEDAITELGEKLDSILKDFQEGNRPVSLGVQFRTLVPITRNGTEAYEMVDSSPPFDWIRAERDTEGKVLKEGHPLDRNHLEQYLEGYLDYVYGSQDQSDPDAPRGLIADGVVNSEAEITVEVMVYKAFQAAPLSDHMAIKNERHPLSRLANVLIKYGQNDDTSYVGKNWAVDGIVFLTSDQAPKARGEVWKTRNLVNRVFTNGFQGNLHQLVSAADGKRVYPHPKLDRVRDTPAGAPAQNNFAANNSHEGSSMSGAQNVQSVQLTAPDTTNMFNDDDDGADDNYFTQATQQPAAQTAPSSVDVGLNDGEEDDVGFDTPSAETSEENKDDGKGRSDRFNRNRNRTNV